MQTNIYFLSKTFFARLFIFLQTHWQNNSDKRCDKLLEIMKVAILNHSFENIL